MFAQLLLPVTLMVGQGEPSHRPCTATVKMPAPALSPAPRWITDLDVALTMAPRELRGYRIAVRDARVEEVDTGGFWISGESGACRVFIRPAEGSLVRVSAGELIDFQGEFRFWPGTVARPEGVYVYAYIVRKAPEALP